MHSAVFAVERWLTGLKSVTRGYCIETDKNIINFFLGLVALPLRFSNTALWLRNANGKGSLSLGWT